MTSKNEDDYWNSSSFSAFNFDDEEILQSLSNFESQSTISDNSNILPLEAIISQSGLNLILDDISSTLEYVIPPIEETIQKAFNGEKYSFEIYRRFSDKIKLLDSALETSDGDIILKAILFLKSSLRPNIFFQQLSKRKVAVKHYAYHLIILNQFQELSDFYMVTGNSPSLKHIFYLIGIDNKNKNVLYKKMKQFSVENLQTLSNHDETLEIQDTLKFLEWQNEKNQTADSVVEQLALLCKDEWKKNTNSNVNIMEFKKLFKIDDMAFDWTVMNVLASMEHWPQLTALFVKPNWFTKKNILKTALSQEIFVFGLSRHKPPIDILEQYLNCMTDSEKSLHLALKLQCHKIVIQHYINQKDRLALIGYKTRVAPHTEEYFLIENALHSPDKKWKN